MLRDEKRVYRGLAIVVTLGALVTLCVGWGEFRQFGPGPYRWIPAGTSALAVATAIIFWMRVYLNSDR